MNPFFADIKIVTSEYLTEKETTLEPRSWRERLFTRPWRPWQATKLVTREVPSTKVIMLDHKTMLVHPISFTKISGLFDATRKL